MRNYYLLLVCFAFAVACGDGSGVNANNDSLQPSTNGEDVSLQRAIAFVASVQAAMEAAEVSDPSVFSITALASSEEDRLALTTEINAEQCTERPMPEPRADFIGTITGDQGGICTVTTEYGASSTDFSIALDCQDYATVVPLTDGTTSMATINGMLGTTLSYSELFQNVVITFSSADVAIMVDEITCPYTWNLSVTFDGTTERAESDGCLSYCDQALEINQNIGFDEL